MFKNRAIQVKFINPKNETPSSSQTDHEFEGKTTIVAYAVERMFDKAIVVMVSYVALDTLRKILVAKATRS